MSVVLMLAAGGCGEDAEDSGSTAKAETEVRSVVERYFKALASGETSTACEVLGKEPRDRLGRVGGGSCADQLRTVLAEVPKELQTELAEAQIATLKVDGDVAEVTMRKTAFSAEGPDDSVTLKRGDGGWLISELPKGGKPSPAAQCLEGGIDTFEKGEAGSFWKRQGRSRLVEYLKRYCVEIVRAGLEEKVDDPKIEEIAEKVIGDMEREGLLKK